MHRVVSEVIKEDVGNKSVFYVRSKVRGFEGESRGNMADIYRNTMTRFSQRLTNSLSKTQSRKTRGSR